MLSSFPFAGVSLRKLLCSKACMADRHEKNWLILCIFFLANAPAVINSFPSLFTHLSAARFAFKLVASFRALSDELACSFPHML